MAGWEGRAQQVQPGQRTLATSHIMEVPEVEAVGRRRTAEEAEAARAIQRTADLAQQTRLLERLVLRAEVLEDLARVQFQLLLQVRQMAVAVAVLAQHLQLVPEPLAKLELLFLCE